MSRLTRFLRRRARPRWSKAIRDAILVPPSPLPMPDPKPQVPPDATLRIDVNLPKNRWQSGHYCVSDVAGEVLMRGRCRGKADNQRATAEGNPSRNPIHPFGDTPSGGYQPTFLIVPDKPHHYMGAAYIPLIGGDGQALQARMGKTADGHFKKKRTELYIHAGRGDEKLMATLGCLRWFDRDMKKFMGLVAGRSIVVTITDV